MDSSMMKLWKKWNVRVTVLLSLMHQIVLIMLGNRRKHNRKLWIRIVVWCAYLSADIVATFALGIITNNISHIDEKNAGSMEANIDLIAFWAPFLLLHLGGPDTITAYSLEDNELWLRHLLGLVVQTVMTIYVSVMIWTHSHLSFLSLIMFFAGLIKYGERTWVLRKASAEKIRESFIEVEITHLCSAIRRCANSYHENLFQGYYLMDLCFQPLFLDLKLSDTIINHKIFGNSSDAFQVIEMSLVFMYNFLYTKAFLLYTRGGLALRVITVILTSCVLGLFPHIIHENKYSKIDVIITFVLLYGAIILEIYSALLLLFSDRFQVWLMRHLKFSVFEALKSFLPQKSWSNNMSQLSLVSFMVGSPLPCRNFLEHFGIAEKLENQWYAFDFKIPNDLKDLIFRYLETKKAQAPPAEGQNILAHCPDFTEELEKSILAWHVVTEKWYGIDQEFLQEKGPNVELHCELICQISRYMFYLLALHPNMVSDTSTTKITLQSILSAARDLPCASANEAFQELTTRSLLDRTKSKITEGTKNLIGYNYDIYHFFNDNLPPFLDEVRVQPWEERWMIISCTWLEMLPYAACKCRGIQHAQQLKCGGEFLSHVWVLTKCFGFTEKDFTPRAPRLPTSIIDFGDASS